MATKKAASTARKTAVKKPVAKKQTTRTKVTTVKAVEPAHVSRPVVAQSATRTRSINYTSLLSSALAELIGTFVLTAIVLAQAGAPLAVLFGIAGAAIAVTALSGAHINPAITIGAWVTRRISAWRALCYVVAQVLGGMLALLVVNAFVTGSAPEANAQMQQAAVTVFHAAQIPAGKEWLVMWAELLGSAIFIFIVASAFNRKRNDLSTAMTIGLGLFTGLLVASSATTALLTAQGTGLTFLNPAVAIGSQVFANFNLWTVVIYMLMPVIGGIVGFGLYDLLKVGRGSDVDARA